MLLESELCCHFFGGVVHLRHTFSMWRCVQMLRTKRNYSISTIRTVLEIVAVGQKVELLVIVLWLTINAPHLTYAPQKY